MDPRQTHDPVVFPAAALDQLLDAIRRRGFRLVGHVVRDGAICYDDITSVADLPAGWTDEQDAGSYRLTHSSDDPALFGYTVGPHSWLIEPHRWEFDGRAIERVLAVKMDGSCLRGKCEQDPHLGYELMRRFAGLATNRLQAARLQLLDVYGHAGDG